MQREYCHRCFWKHPGRSNIWWENFSSRKVIEEECSAANKYYSFAGHHEQKNKKTTCQNNE